MLFPLTLSTEFSPSTFLPLKPLVFAHWEERELTRVTALYFYCEGEKNVSYTTAFYRGKAFTCTVSCVSFNNPLGTHQGERAKGALT